MLTGPNLFSGNSKQDKYTKECLDYFIEALKKDKIVEIEIDPEYYALRIRYCNGNGYVGIGDLISDVFGDEFENTEDLEEEALRAAEIRNKVKKIGIVKKLNIGRNAFIKNITDTVGDDLGAAVEFDFKFTKDKNGNIVLKDNNEQKTLEEIKKELTENLDEEDKEEKLKAEAKIRIVEKLAKNELIKKALSVSEKKEEKQEQEQEQEQKDYESN